MTEDELRRWLVKDALTGTCSLYTSTRTLWLMRIGKLARATKDFTLDELNPQVLHSLAAIAQRETLNLFDMDLFAVTLSGVGRTIWDMAQGIAADAKPKIPAAPKWGFK